MIPRQYIQEWSKFVPWQERRQVEQDLIITKSLLKIYGNDYLRESLAFRGGTALNKLFFDPPSRYSEDIDLVQTNSEPIGKTIDLLRECLDSWLGEPRRSFSEGGVTLTYKMTSEDDLPIRLKIEINSREHFSTLGFKYYSFQSNSSWEKGKVNIKSYSIEELLSTKLRALYQRRKGRDLFDLYIALSTIEKIETKKIIDSFQEYMKNGNHKISKKLFIENMEAKIKNKDFISDMKLLLANRDDNYSPADAYVFIKEKLLEKISP